jgi:hypothetical protein
MRREEKFVLSHRPYAVDPESLRIEHHPAQETPPTREYWRITMDAVWFRGRKDAPVATAGGLWGSTHEEPRDVTHALELFNDGRYGGSAVARWDGVGLWINGLSLEESEGYLAILRPMLENFPAIPPGYDGWWVY